MQDKLGHMFSGHGWSIREVTGDMSEGSRSEILWSMDFVGSLICEKHEFSNLETELFVIEANVSSIADKLGEGYRGLHCASFPATANTSPSKGGERCGLQSILCISTTIGIRSRLLHNDLINLLVPLNPVTIS